MKKSIVFLLVVSMAAGLFIMQPICAAGETMTLAVHQTNAGYLAVAEGTADASKAHVFYAASYDADKKLVGVESAEVPAGSEARWASFAINAAKTSYFSKIDSTKFFMWEKDTLVPAADWVANTAATPVSTVDAAASSAVFVSTAADGHLPEAAVDGNTTTYWQAYTSSDFPAETGASCYRQRYIVDLGAAYPIHSIEYLPADEASASMFDIAVSNDPEFEFANIKYIQGRSETAISTEEATTYAVKEAEAYRYVMVEKIYAYGTLGIKELKVNVPELFYAASADNQTYLTDNVYGYRTAVGKTANAFSYTIMGGKEMSRTDYDAISLAVPLNTASAVTHIAYESGSSGTGPNQYDYRSDFKILGLEPGECTLSGNVIPTFDLANADVLATQEGIAGLDTYAYSGLMLYEVPEQFKNKSYEYIVFYKDTKYDNGTAEDTADDKLQLRVNSLYVYNYTKGLPLSTQTLDAASDSMVYTITNSEGHAGTYAVDNDSATYYESGSVTDARLNNLVIDLGAAYPIASIDYLPANDDTAAANYSIYLSNDPQFEDKMLIHSQGATVADKASATTYPVPVSTAYRYVLVEKMAGTGKLGVAEINVNVPQTLYASVAGTSRAGFTVANRGKKVYRSATSSVNAGEVNNANGENILNTYPHDWTGLTQDSTETVYLRYDLGEAKKIDTIAFAACESSAGGVELARRSDFKVILSNNADLSDGVTIYTQEGIAGGNDTLADSGLVLYEVPEAYKNNTYRYVGLYKDTLAYLNSNYSLRLALGILDIYTPTN